MGSRIAAMSLALLVTALLGVIAANVLVAQAQPSSMSTLDKQSVINQVPAFYAEGERNGFSLKISPNGGYLSTSSSSMTLMPWGYVTAKWSTGTVYIIFLANVTETDFHIGFLYLTNSSNQFALRLFGYQAGTLNTLTFDGTPTVYARMVETSSMTMPDVHIQPKARVDNTLSAMGPELYVNHNYGVMMNGTNILKITAIQNQIFQGPNDYNELWSLLTDNFGNYYFAILYMQNSDQNHVILEHQVRLNDYQTLLGRTFDARWVGGSFTSFLKVTLPRSVSVVKVDGFPFQTNNMGTVTIYVPSGVTTIEVQNEITSTPDVKLLFASWDNYGNQNPLKLTINSYADLKANYQAEYLLTLQTEYGEAKGTGWYAQGTNATFSVPSLVASNNGTRRVFQNFSGDSNSTSNLSWVIMNSSKHISAVWKTQFDVKLESIGVPANSTVVLTINGNSQLLNGSNISEQWVDNGKQLTIEVQTRQIQGANVNYNFKGLQVDGQVSSANIVITRPVLISIVFSDQQKAPTNIDLKATPASTVSGYPVALTGSVSGIDGSSKVTISYSTDKLDWQRLANVSTAQGGSFTYVWTPSHSGTYFIEASWSGDAQHEPSSKTTSVQVQDVTPTALVRSSSLTELVQDVTKQISAVPFLELPLELARSLLVLGAISANLLNPNASPVLGYFIGSILVGFVFVFPISAVILSIKAARSRRPPSAVWLTPLATIWTAALFLFVTNGAFVGVPQVIVAASLVLLTLSSALLVPLTISLLLARAVAG
jgi:hypothetical protein